MKSLRTRAVKLIMLSGFIVSGLSAFSSSLLAVEKVYFSTSDGEKFWCDRDNLEFHMDPNGKLSELCNFMLEDGEHAGQSEATSHELDFNGRLFKEYILDLLRRGEVSFKDKADAENTLRICENLGLPAAEEYICKVLKRKPRRELKSPDSKDTRVANARLQNIDCPEGYVMVPGNESYNTPGQGEDFCVMKYAASNSGNRTAVSIQGAAPWVNINRADAATACLANGEGYHLITNAEWMTIARDIEANEVNWNNGAGPVGTGTLSRGNSNSNAALAPGTDESSVATNWINRRTHTLSTGEMIWDMAGNVWQWVSDSPTLGGQSQWQEMSILADANHRLQFGPSGGFTSAQGVGKIVPGSAGAVLRGGAWSSGSAGAGVFAAYLSHSATYTSRYFGFRCAVSASGAR